MFAREWPLRLRGWLPRIGRWVRSDDWFGRGFLTLLGAGFAWRAWRWGWEADVHEWIVAVVVVGGLIWCAVSAKRRDNEICANCGHTRDGHPNNPGIAGDHWFTKRARKHVLPMQVRVGDCLVDETAEWEIVDHPYTTNSGKTAHIRIRRVDQPDVTQIRSWCAHERIAVKRVAYD